jgi:DNA-binding MarR family transcriptional regulator
MMPLMSKSTPIAPVERQGLDAAKQANTGQLLLKCARLLDEAAIARVNRQAEMPVVLRPAHTKLFPHIDFTGTRISTVAERLGVTKQAVSQLCGELAELGVVALDPDPDDGRAKRVRFTRKGLEAIHHGLGVLAGIERELAAAVGEARMAALQRTLQALVPVLEKLAAPPR